MDAKTGGHTMKETIPYLFYLAGSLCFAIGTLVVLIRMAVK